jgi:ferredoxin--NADP+ reductase
MTYLSDFDTSHTIQAKVTGTHRITPDTVPEVRSIHMLIDHPDFNYKEGQHVGVSVPGRHEFGHDTHFRLYTIANSPQLNKNKDSVEIELCVRRCFYIDEFSGEEEPGIASNYLCDLKSGDTLTLSGPYGDAFEIPEDPETNLLMIGSGTGIAPFRAFSQHIYAAQPDWKGQLMLFYGARSGTENLYRNEINSDMDKYYDQKTFKAFEGLSQRPWMNREDDGLHNLLEDNAEEIWELIQNPKTHVYLAGLEKTKTNFEDIMRSVAGSNARWQWMREEMIEQGRWSELMYN